jgi:hypothetical protein
MSVQRKENPGRGLSEEDLGLIFPEEDSMSEADAQPQTFEDMPWPADPPEVPKDETRSHLEQDVQGLTKSAGRSIANDMKEPKSQIPERVRGESMPSDRTWLQTIKKIFRPAEFRGSSTPCPRGSVRPFLEKGYNGQAKT